MTTPPGRYGGPGVYGPPQPYGPGPPGGPGGPGGPPRKNVLPWALAGLGTLVVVLGVLLVVLFTRDGDPAPVAAPAGETSPAATTGDGGAVGRPADGPDDQGSPPQNPDSEQAAIDFVQALVDGDAQRAYDLACGLEQSNAEVLALLQGTTPEEALVNRFQENLTGGRAVTGATLDALYNVDQAVDRAEFTLELGAGARARVYMDMQVDSPDPCWFDTLD